MSADPAKTLFEKVWEQHIVSQEAGCPAVFYIDLHLIHEVTSPQAFTGLKERNLKVRRPDRTVATMDHLTPTLPAKLAVLDTAEVTCVGIDNINGQPYRTNEGFYVQAAAPLMTTGN